MKRITRRDFVIRSTAAGIGVPLLLPQLSLAQSPNGKLRHAAIGVGGKGWGSLKVTAAKDNVECVAICDLDETNLARAAEMFPEARTYQDWRELLDKEQDRIDALSITTPDHMHAPIAMSAIRRGKHVYCEKPLTHEVFEARQLTLAARRAGVVTQMGIQIHGCAEYRTAVRMLQDGVIGKIVEFHSWCNAPGWPQGIARPEGEDPVPDGFSWDQWVGVAPMRPYKQDVYHPFRWRGWRDFGCGALGDFACHILDPIVTALGLGPPTTVRAEVPEDWARNVAVNRETWPKWEIVHYEFPGTDMTAAGTIQGTWYDGGKLPPRELAKLPPRKPAKLPGDKPPDDKLPDEELPDEEPLPRRGSLIIGEKGVMLLPHYQGGPRLLPEEKFRDHAYPKLDTYCHIGQWVDASLGKGKTSANFDYAGPLTETVLLGTVAVCLAGQTLHWDAANMKITNLPEANRYLRRPYREGWSIEGLG
jgi:predicted dehydrogenase